MFWLKKKNYLCSHSYSVDYSLHTKHFAMKKKILSLAAAVAMLGMFASCSSDDPKSPTPNPDPDPDPVVVPGEDLTAKEYSGTSATVTMGDAPVAGQIVKFTPGTEPKLTIESEPINLSELIGGAAAQSKADGDIMLPTPGLIPGSPSVTIPLTLTGEADTCSFTGNTQTDYCTFNYTGAVGPNGVTLKISDVKLKNTSLAGKYNLNPYSDMNSHTIARTVWKSEEGLELFPGSGYKMPMGDLLSLAVVLPLIGEDEDGNPQFSVCQMLQAALKSVTFAEDGNLTAEYAEILEDGSLSDQFTTSPVGIAQYVVRDDNTLLLFLNPQQIIANTLSKATDSGVNPNQVIEGLINYLLPMVANGIPVNFGRALEASYDEDYNLVTKPSEDPNSYSFYLGTEVLLPILKTVSPLLSDPSVIEMIMAEVKKDPEMADMADMLQGMLMSLPGVIDTTSEVEIGINFTRQ